MKSKDPAYKYAKDILKGKIRSGPHIRATCKRFMDDWMNAKKRGYVYDQIQAEKAVMFFEKLLTLSGGDNGVSPFKLLPWQQFAVRNIYGWIEKATGYRRFRKVYIETAKGSGKSPLVAGMGIRAICGDNEKGAQGFVIARTSDQAKVTFEPAVEMVEGHELLAARLKVYGGSNPTRIVDASTSSRLTRVAGDKKGRQSGPRPHIVIVDEYHEHESAALRDMYAAGFKNRTQPLMVMITNSGVSMQSPCGQEHRYACAVAAQELEDDQYFSLVYSCDADDDVMGDESCWIKANPSLCNNPADDGKSGVVSIPGYKYIREQVKEARGMPSKRSVIERLNFCRWVDADDPWVDKEAWEDCEVEKLSDYEIRKDKPCWIGLDISAKIDLTAATICWNMGDGKYEAETMCWTPTDTLYQRAERDSLPYQDWVDKGFLTATPGKVVDMGFIAHYITEMGAKYNLQGVAYDPWRIDVLTQELDRQGIRASNTPDDGLHIVPHPQGFRAGSPPLDDPIAESEKPLYFYMPRSIDYTEEVLLSRKISIAVNPCLRMAVAGMVVVADAAGNRRPTKTLSLLKIDPAVSLLMAVGGCIQKERGDEYHREYSVEQLML